MDLSATVGLSQYDISMGIRAVVLAEGQVSNKLFSIIFDGEGVRLDDATSFKELDICLSGGVS
jgi:hypothetical protein